MGPMPFDRPDPGEGRILLTVLFPGPIRRSPFAGVLIEGVDLREGMRGRRRGSPDACALCERLEALIGSGLEGESPLGPAWDELESLILAQNERWRHA